MMAFNTNQNGNGLLNGNRNGIEKSRWRENGFYSDRDHEVFERATNWRWHPRWEGIRRDYSADHVVQLRNSFSIEYTLADRGSRRLWDLLRNQETISALGAFTGNQAVQQVKAGLQAVYVSGGQVAADANLSGLMYPDQSLYPANSVPDVVRRINQALLRADQIHHAEGDSSHHWMAPIVADGEAGFGGVLNVFELTRSMIEAGTAGVHFEDQLASEKKCGHLGGKVLVPTRHFIETLTAARLATDVMNVPMILVARTDADSASLISSDIDERDHEFIDPDERTPEGFFRVRSGLDHAIARGLAYAPYADLIWCESSMPSLDHAKRFAESIKKEFPDKMLAYNCSTSFNWRKHLDEGTISQFQRELGAMGYAFQFVTLAAFHAVNYSMFKLARAYRKRGMLAYSRLQEAEFEMESKGYTATHHQREVGTGYSDIVRSVITGGQTSVGAMSNSTEAAQFS